MEITHKLIHVRKELCERDRLDEPDGAECCELAPGDGCGRGPRRCLRLDVSVVKEGACLVERVIGTGGRHGEEGGGDGKGREAGGSESVALLWPYVMPGRNDLRREQQQDRGTPILG